MSCISTFHLFIQVVWVTIHALNQGNEYCQLEAFEAKCSRNELILVEEAKYGRMNIGKCITQKEVSGVLGQDSQYFGCYKDVTDVMHKKCSLNTECQVIIPNADLDLTNPCFPGLKSYLKANYRCIDAAIESDESCRIITSQRPKYIASTYKGQCGRNEHPWIIEVSRGQNIKTSITLLNKTDQFRSILKCDKVIGYIKEIDRNIKRNVSICSDGFFIGKDESGGLREEFLSRSSLLEMYFNEKSIQDLNSMFLIGLEAYGCLDIIPPEDTWLKRTNDDIVIGCYSSKQTWYLRCENGKWSGSIGNCSMNLKSANDFSDTLTTKGYNDAMSEEQQIILFVAICALGVVICLVIVCIGAICIKRYRWKSGATNIYNKQPIYYPSVQYSTDTHTIGDNQQKSLNKMTENFNGNLSNKQAPHEKSEENKYFVLEDDTFAQ